MAVTQPNRQVRPALPALAAALLGRAATVRGKARARGLASSPDARRRPTWGRWAPGRKAVEEVMRAADEHDHRMAAALAGQLAQGTARQMSAGGGGVYSAIRGSLNIVGNAKFVPVATSAGGGAAADGAAAMAGAGAVGAVLAAAPIVLLLVATAGRVYAEEQRRQALERVENPLNERRYADLEAEWV